MTSRERVRKILTFSKPDRVPLDLWELPYISLFRKDELEIVQRKYPSDIGRPELSPGGGGDDGIKKLAKAGTYVDEWGSVWEIAEPGIVGKLRSLCFPTGRNSISSNLRGTL